MLLMIAMKLFRPPKNMTGKEKKTEIKNPIYIVKYNPYAIYSRVKASKKFAFKFLPNKQYPIFPTKM